MITRLYLDVDGTVSPIGNEPPANSGWDKWASGRAFGFTVFWAEQLIVELNEITARPDVKPVWLTSWQDAAATSLSPVTGLNGEGWPVLPISHAQNKLAALREDLAEQERVSNRVDRIVWMDDHLGRMRAAREWSAQSSIPVLRLMPGTLVGLTPKHITQVQEFLGTPP